jgi:molybdenum cofactor cytidylyltransferase
MKFGPVPLQAAVGKILGHNLAGSDGKRMLRKGAALTQADVEKIQALGRDMVYVAELEPGDLDEDQAAQRIAAALIGPHMRSSGRSTGRVNLIAAQSGILRIDHVRLAKINDREGIVVITRPADGWVKPRERIATIKMIPYGLPEAEVAAAEAVASQSGALMRIDPLRLSRIGLIFSGSPAMRERMVADFAALYERLNALGAEVTDQDFIPLEDYAGESQLAERMAAQANRGCEMIVLAGETAIMDRHDIVPRALERAGGAIESVGAPVDPGNLFMLGYLGAVPVVGVPGCARSKKRNIVDLILPRLMAGERMTRQDITQLGAGGLLSQ